MLNTKINNYHLQNELGRGGMATVYLAHDNKFDTSVAIKVLNKEYVHNDNIRKRFLAEARNMFKMSHPNIIKVSDLIDEGDTVAFVMEYIEGETLKEYLDRKGKLKDDEIKTIFTQMLDAVGYVHEQNLVHRDIKPSNFMIDKKGKVKLMDFGIAKNTDTNSAEYTQTGTGVQMGTPMYMSPEQITETKSVTAQSDIYSLGVVLWQMVTGRKPYDTSTLSTFQLQMKIVQEPLQVCVSNFNAIIQKATQKDPAHRFNNCLEVYNNLGSYIFQPPTCTEKSQVNDETIINLTVSSGIQKTKFNEQQNTNGCDQCLGKGYLNRDDISRLGLQNSLKPSKCPKCANKSELNIIEINHTLVETHLPALKTDDYGIDFIWVEGGTFTMGSPENDADRNDDEHEHRVTLDGYYMSKYPITQAQWQKVIGDNPSTFKGNGSDCPVETVSWDDCQEFINKLNKVLGTKYRLPTEAEWEFAAKGGVKSKGYTYAGSNDIEEVAWFRGNRCIEVEKRTLWGLSNNKETLYFGPHPIGKKKGNELGLHDMSGNVCEWCADWYGDYPGSPQTNPQGPLTGSSRVLRGGGWSYFARFCRSALRNYAATGYRNRNLGFRLVSP